MELSELISHNPRKTKAFFAYIFSAVVVSGCGGGGGGGGGGSESGAGSGNTGQDTFYAVTASAGTGGGISPATVQVKSGAVTTLQLSVNTGYKIATVTGCNGTLNGTTYTTGAMTANCVVNASFELIKYNVNAVASEGGSIAPGNVSVEHGKTASFTLTPKAGFKISSVEGCQGRLNNSIYTTGAVTVDCTVTAAFSASVAPTALIELPDSITDRSTLEINGAGSTYDPALSLSFQWSITTDHAAELQLEDAQKAQAKVKVPDLMEDSVLEVTLAVTDSAGRVDTATKQIVLTNNQHNHNVALRVVRVTTDWLPYASTDGWTSAITQKESTYLKHFEVAIWEEVSAVHLYEFPNSYDPLYGLTAGITEEEKINYREQYRVLKIEGMPAVAQAEERSKFLLRAFIDISNYVAKRYPDSDHHLIYSGHGGPGGKLFEAQLHYQDAASFLAAYRAALGRKLGVIDMGGPCSQGSFSDLDNFCQHSRYYIASDLANGGYQFDDWSHEKYVETSPDHQYPLLFSSKRNLGDILYDRIDLKRKAYEYSIANMRQNKVMQGNYLYSCAKFPALRQGVVEFLKKTAQPYQLHDDLKTYLITHGASEQLLQSFDQTILHHADNKDFFQWSEERNGMMMPDPQQLN